MGLRNLSSMCRFSALGMGSSQGETIFGRFAGSGRKSGSMISAEGEALFLEELEVTFEERAEVA